VSTTDVNEKFNRDRRALMQSAGARRRPDGTYAATVGYDRGEVIGRDGLDTSRGTAALYTSTPAWHGLGTVIPGGISDIDTVLAVGQIDFQVDKVPVRYRYDGSDRVMEDRWVTVRSDTGAALGTVGHRYEVFQQRKIFTFLEDLADTHGVLWESAGALRGGRRVFVTMQVPDSVIVDRGGLDDEIRLYIVAINSHDATSQAEVVVTPWRVVCANTERFALADAASRWAIRHTSSGLENFAEARRTLGLTLKYAAVFEAEQTALARTDIALADFHRVIADLWPLDDDATDRTRTSRAKRTGTLDAMFRTETERAGRTAYAAERAITDYLDHVAPRRPGRTMTEEIARATALLEGTDDDTKTKAHKRLLLLTRT
jgi:phage/plasmid-like protein (TIGR03299 family)